MNLHAAFVPPPWLVQPALDVVEGKQAREQVVAAPKRKIFGRRHADDSPAPYTGRPRLDVLDQSQVFVPITTFGYITRTDAERLADAVSEATAHLKPATLRMAGGAALVDPEDRCVWTELVGDEQEINNLRAIASAVVSSVERLGLFCDRRRMKPRVALATINDFTTVEHLEDVLHRLEEWKSEPWIVQEVAIMHRTYDISSVWHASPVGR